MAIVEMKHLTLLAPKADRDRLLRALQKMNCVEISPPQEENAAYGETDSAGAQETGEQMKRIEWALSQLSKFDKSQKPLFGPQRCWRTKNTIGIPLKPWRASSAGAAS